MLNRKVWEPPSHARSSKYRVNIFAIKHLSTSAILGKSHLFNEDFWMPMDFWYPLTEINISSRNLFSSFLDWKIEDIDKIGGCGANLCFARRGGRAQENYPRMEGGMRDWDATSVRKGVIGGARDGNRDQYRHSDFTWFYVNTSCNRDDHGGATCISRL